MHLDELNTIRQPASSYLLFIRSYRPVTASASFDPNDHEPRLLIKIAPEPLKVAWILWSLGFGRLVDKAIAIAIQKSIGAPDTPCIPLRVEVKGAKGVRKAQKQSP